MKLSKVALNEKNKKGRSDYGACTFTIMNQVNYLACLFFVLLPISAASAKFPFQQLI